MPLFSQRKGITPLKKEFQRESIDDDLRNRLWSALKAIVWDEWSPANFYDGFDTNSRIVNVLLDRIWIHYFKLPLDTRPQLNVGGPSNDSGYARIRKFFFEAMWYEVYDFIEFVMKNIPEVWAEELRSFCNTLLEDENAAYRILGNEVVEITDKTEIEAIEDALGLSIKSISQHLRRALQLLSDKKEPDYRNSIKESISAVESCCQYLTGTSKATLGDALKKISGAFQVHPALKKGFLSIYGYASDAGGIWHALFDGDQSPSYADAKFMLVACSAFVNFLLTKTAETERK